MARAEKESKTYPLFIRNFNGDLIAIEGGGIQKRNLGRDGEKFYFDIVTGNSPLSARIGGETESKAKQAAQDLIDSLTLLLQSAQVENGMLIVDMPKP